MLGGKAGSKVKPQTQGVRGDTSIYGSTIPVIIGRTRVPPKMIFAGNFRTHKSNTKKLGGKKSQKMTSYSANFDWLLGYAPIPYIADIWRNKDNFWPVSVTSVTSSSGSVALISPGAGPVLGILGVLATVNVNSTFNDYGAPGPVTITGQQSIPCYPAGANGSQAAFAMLSPGGFDWSTWSSLPFYSVSDGGHGDNVPRAVNVSNVIVNAGNPVTVFFFYSGPAKTPLTQSALIHERVLGNAGIQAISYPEFAGIGGTNVDLGTGNTAPNDNFEVIGLYGISQNGDANPADAILDIILGGNPAAMPAAPVNTNFNWNHGLNFDIVDFPQGNPTIPNSLTDPPQPGTPYCWIAAAVYNEDMFWGPRVSLIRRWLRDDYGKTLTGRAVLSLYKLIGKPLARIIPGSPLLKSLFRFVFDKALARAQAKYGR